MAVALLVLLTGCSSGAGDDVLVEGQDWQLVVGRGPELRYRDGEAPSKTSTYTKPVSLEKASTFLTSDGTTVFAGPVSNDAAKVTVATRDGGESSSKLVVAHGVTWFWVQLPGEHEAAGYVAHDEAGKVVDEHSLPAIPGFGDYIRIEPNPL